MLREIRSTCRLVLLLGVVLCLWASLAFPLDAPHDSSNNVGCNNCHATHGTGWGFVPRGQPQSDMCKSCHKPGGQAATMADMGTHLHGTHDGTDNNVDCGSCHDVHRRVASTDAHNGDLVANNMSLIRSNPQKYVPTALTQAVFQTRPAHFSFDSAPFDGLCQSCHTVTDYAKNDGTDPHHQGTEPENLDCITCHPHSDSFRPSGSCTDCHASPQGTGDNRRQVVESGGTGGDFSGGGGGPTTSTVRDEFTSVSYGNNDGTATWAGNWVDSEETDPAAGNVQVTAGELRLNSSAGPPPSWVQLTYDDFEGGFGNYTDGGSDCALYTGGTYAHQGSNAADVQDNTDTSSSFTLTTPIDVATPGYTQIRVEFWFRAEGLASGEDFWLLYNDGTTWQTVQTWVAGTDFNTGQFYSESVIIQEGTYTFPTDMQIGFQCDASGNGDDVYIDEVRIEALDPGGVGTPPSAAREVDLSGGVTSATFTFDYRTVGVEAGDDLVVEVSANGGGSYNPLDTVASASSGSKSYDILAYAASNTRVRLRISTGYDEAGEYFYADNVQVEYVSPPAGGTPTFHVSNGTGTEIVTEADSHGQAERPGWRDGHRL